MNKVILIGRLTRDPHVSYSQGEQSMCVARYTLAVDRRFKRDGGQEADFIGCVAFGRQGEFAERYLKQGTKIAITGRIQTGSYTNREGQKVYTTDVVVEDHEFVESKASAANYNAQSYPQQGSYNQEPQQPSMTSRPAPSAAANEGFMTIPEGIEEELPFI